MWEFKNNKKQYPYIGSSIDNSHEGYVIYAHAKSNISLPIGVCSSDGNVQAKCSLNYIPRTLKLFLIQIEDRKFHKHFGVDMFAIIRALIANIKKGKIVQGGSTLTQQLARNLFKDNRKNIFRKIKEIFYSILLEFKYSKNSILELYFNNVYWGKNLYGIRSASLFYFKKEVSDIKINDQITLLTLLRGPNYYLKNQKELIARKSLIGGIIRRNNLISTRRTIKMDGKKVHFLDNKLLTFKEEVIPFISEKTEPKSYTIHSTLNIKLQRYLHNLMLKDKKQLSVVVIEKNKVKGVESKFGSGYPFCFRSNVGSTLKPLLYCILRNNGIFENDLISTRNENHLKWPVREAYEVQQCKMTLKEGLQNSHNNIFVNASFSIGINLVINELKKYLPDHEILTPSIILGSSRKGISLFELSNLYNSFFTNACSGKEDQFIIKQECRDTLYHIMKNKLKIDLENGYLKTGTTNNSRQRFAIVGNSSTTIGFLAEGFKGIEQEDYDKDFDFINQIRNYITDILELI